MDQQDNPFALAIRDHATHFTARSLCQVLEKAGFAVKAGPANWVAKEWSVVAADGSVSVPAAVDSSVVDDLRAAVDWLKRVVVKARDIAGSSRLFGIFGTAVAGTFVSAPMIEGVDFFVDEDPSRIGGKHLGRPIYSPADVPHGADVYVPLAPVLAGALCIRLKGSCKGRIHAAPSV